MRRRRLTGAFSVGLSELAVLLAVAIMAVALGFVVEDLLPAHAVWRWVALVVALAALVGAIALHRHTRRVAGTLFYVRLLDEGMADYQVESLRSARRRKMALRWVSSWVDLAEARTGDGVVDVVAPRQRLSAALADRLGGDSDETGYAIAPNLLWPAAVAVGAELPFVEHLELVELRGSRRSRPGRRDELHFPLHRKPAPGELAIVSERFTVAEPRGDRFGLHLAFTRPARTVLPEHFQRFGVADGRVLRPNRDVAIREYDEAELAHLAAELPHLVAGIKNELVQQGRELVVVGMLPKTVALALGWGLGQAQCRFFRGTYLMYRDRDVDQDVARDPAAKADPIPRLFGAMRVHASQPPGYPS